MPATQPRAAGWHPDPDDPGSLRHWDGRRWGSERRRRPSWAPPPGVPTSPDVPGADDEEGNPAPAEAPRRRWSVLAAVAVVLALLVVSVPGWLDRGPQIPSRSVGDTAFTNRADAVCERALPPLRRQRPEAREDTGTDAAFAARIDTAADGLAEVARELRALPVAEADAAEVHRWLDAWDDYVTVGRRYARRVRAGEGRAAEATRADAAPLERRIYVFAKANGMPACTL